jgi:hypothetical protein
MPSRYTRSRPCSRFQSLDYKLVAAIESQDHWSKSQSLPWRATDEIVIAQAFPQYLCFVIMSKSNCIKISERNDMQCRPFDRGKCGVEP